MGSESSADLLIRGGRIVDGGGGPWHRGEIAIEGGRIVAMGSSLHFDATEVLDVDDLVVAPGFIDLHAHADLGILIDGQWASALDQGVTTIVIGQDGLGLAPINENTVEIRRQLRGINGDPDAVIWSWRSFGEYLGRLESTALGPNVATMVSHGTVRLHVLGESMGTPGEEETRRMQSLVSDAMDQGAFGLSAGLTYPPGSFALDSELVDLCRAIRPFGGFYQPHHRNYGNRALQEYAASIDIGHQAGVPVHLTHAHLSFAVNAGRAPELLTLVDSARSSGDDVTLDSYPYLSGSTYLAAFLPSWSGVGGVDAVIARLEDTSIRARIAAEMDAGSDGFQGVPVDWTAMRIAGVDGDERSWCVGLTMEGIARRWKVAPFEAFCRLLVDDRLGPLAILEVGDESNVRAIMAHPAHMPASDGIVVGQRPHPRAWGTFPRYLGHYVRELGIVTLEEMVRKMTSAPALRLGLMDRGILRPGAVADMTIFDPGSIIDVATYEDPRRSPIGVPFVIVNGVVIKRDDRLLEARAGQVLRRRSN